MSGSHRGDEGEESFFVSMTDIMVGLLFIFILIIMYFAVQAKIDAAKIEEIESKNKQLTSLLREQGFEKYTELKAYQVQVALQRANLLNWISAFLREDGITGVEVIEEQGVLRLPEGILFDSGQFTFAEDSQAKRTAQSIARALSVVLPCSVLDGDGKPFKATASCAESFYHNKNLGFVQSLYVEGHTDDVPIVRGLRGDPNLKNNLKLSARRSTNTFDTIVEERGEILSFHGPVLDENKIRFEPILASSAYGEWRPIMANTSAEGRRANRRIDLRLVMYVPPNIEAMKQLADAVGNISERGVDNGPS